MGECNNGHAFGHAHPPNLHPHTFDSYRYHYLNRHASNTSAKLSTGPDSRVLSDADSHVLSNINPDTSAELSTGLDAHGHPLAHLHSHSDFD